MYRMCRGEGIKSLQFSLFDVSVLKRKREDKRQGRLRDTMAGQIDRYFHNATRKHRVLT
jgi:hypothetical protein